METKTLAMNIETYVDNTSIIEKLNVLISMDEPAAATEASELIRRTEPHMDTPVLTSVTQLILQSSISDAEKIRFTESVLGKDYYPGFLLGRDKSDIKNLPPTVFNLILKREIENSRGNLLESRSLNRAFEVAMEESKFKNNNPIIETIADWIGARARESRSLQGSTPAMSALKLLASSEVARAKLVMETVILKEIENAMASSTTYFPDLLIDYPHLGVRLLGNIAKSDPSDASREKAISILISGVKANPKMRYIILEDLFKNELSRLAYEKNYARTEGILLQAKTLAEKIALDAACPTMNDTEVILRSAETR